MTDPLPLIAIVGPTASGKTARGVHLARAVDAEIVSADSRQIYRGMDLGTGKDLDEYGEIPYRMIDIRDAGYRYNLYEYVRDAREAIDDIRGRGKNAVIVGGTGLYVETLLRGLKLPEVPENPELRRQLADKTLPELTEMLASMKRLHNTTDVDTCKRAVRAIEIARYYADNPGMAPTPGNSTPEPSVIIAVDIDRESRRERITRRLKERLDAGMVDEVRRLIDGGLNPDDLIYYGLEYKYLTLYLIGSLTYGEMVTGLETAIHQFAKRQATWFRGMERRGFTVHHLPYDLDPDEFTRRAIGIAGGTGS